MNLTDTHKKLKKEGHVTFNRSYFSQLVREGKIPFKMKDNKKVFRYMQVLKALSDAGKIKMDDDSKEKTVTSTKLELYHWRGILAKLEHDKKAGVLLYRDEVEQKAFTVIRVLRDQLLAMPERITADIMTVHSVEDAEAIMRKELEMILEEIRAENLMP